MLAKDLSRLSLRSPCLWTAFTATQASQGALLRPRRATSREDSTAVKMSDFPSTQVLDGRGKVGGAATTDKGVPEVLTRVEGASLSARFRPPRVMDLVEGIITEVGEDGVVLRLVGWEMEAILPPEHVFNKYRKRNPQPPLRDVFMVGKSIKAVVQEVSASRVVVSTGVLEIDPASFTLHAKNLERFMTYAYKVYAKYRPVVNKLVAFTIEAISPSGLLVVLTLGARGLVPIDQVSRQQGLNYETLQQSFKVGERLKGVVTEHNREKGEFTLSTAAVEATPGSILKDKSEFWKAAQGVWKAAWPKPLDLVQGKVLSVGPRAACIDLGRGFSGWLTSSQLTSRVGPAVDLQTMFTPGEEVKAVVLPPREIHHGKNPHLLYVSTSVLEASPGDMLHRKEVVMDQAEEIWQVRQPLAKVPSVLDVVTGMVTSTSPEYGVSVLLFGGQDGVVSMEDLTEGDAEESLQTFRVGEVIKAVFIKFKVTRGRCYLSTRALERTPGEMLQSKDEVMAHAEETWSHRKPQGGDICPAVVTGVSLKTYSVLFLGLLQGIAIRPRHVNTSDHHVLAVGDEIEVVFVGVSKLNDRCLVKLKGNRVLKVNSVVEGKVQSVTNFGVFVDVGGTVGLLHISQISKERVESIESVFEVGERVKVMVVGGDQATGRWTFSTKKLESFPGEMLRDKQRMFDHAEERGMEYRNKIEAEIEAFQMEMS